MNKYEQYACDQVFNCYPDDFSFEQICEYCLDDEKRQKHNEYANNLEFGNPFELSAQYENEWWENIPDILRGIKESIEQTFPGHN